MPSKIIKIGQISDPHIGDTEEFVQGIDVRANFLKALHSPSMQNLDLLVLSGDLANENAEPGGYHFIKEQIKDYPAPVCIIPGNHDRVEIMKDFYDIEIKNGKCYYSVDVCGRKVFFIDSACGDVSRDQLDWLEREVPKANGEVLLFMHHPPCFCNHRFMDLRFHLSNMIEVQQVLSKFNNLTHIFCGHYHCFFEVQLGRQVVHAAPSTQMQIDPNTPYFNMKSSAPGWFTINWGEDFVDTEAHF